MGQMKKPKRKEPWRGVCIVSATASYQTDYGNMVICELISVGLFLFMPQFIFPTKIVTNKHLIN